MKRAIREAIGRLMYQQATAEGLYLSGPGADEAMNGDHHIYPTHDLVDHDIDDGRECWCQPRVAVPCDDCTDGCWKCEGGLVDVSADHSTRTLVIHNAADGRE